MRRGSSAAHLLVRCGALLTLGVAAFYISCLAVADYLSRRPDLASRERAVRVSPAVPVFHERLAEIRDSLGALPEWKLAAALDPATATRFQELGTHAELANDDLLAEQALQTAARLSTFYQPRYLLAQYYFRRQDAAAFWRWYREALQAAPDDVTPLLELGWRLRPDGESVTRQAAEARPPIARQLLQLLLRHTQLESAGTLAGRIAETALPDDLPALLEYCNQSLEQGESARPMDVWNRLCRRGLLPFQVVDCQAPLTDSGFARPPMAAGFGWHAEPVAGLSAVEFRGELRIRFSGEPADSIVVVWQYVPLEAGAPYRLRVRYQVDGGSSEGLEWRLYYPDGQSNWVSLAADLRSFRAPAKVGRLALVYRRPTATSRLAGTAIVNGLKLERER